MKQIGLRVGLAIIAALTLRACAIEPFRVKGVAMVPAVLPGDVIFTSKLHYGLRVPGSGSMIMQWHPEGRGDVVVLSDVGDPPVTVLRRVVAVAGDRLRVDRGEIQFERDGQWQRFPCEPLGESQYCRESYDTGVSVVVRRPGTDEINADTTAPVLVPRGHIYVLSDDRRDGPDSRHFGPIPIRAVVGNATRVWIRSAEQQTYATEPVIGEYVKGRPALGRIQ